MEIAPAFVEADTVEAEPKTGVSPITGLPEDITPVAAGSFIRSPGFETVYYVDGAGSRHPLWDRQTFFTWKDSWNDVDWVTDATLPTLSFGNALPPKPGVVLIKVQSDPNVYAVENGDDPWRPVLREIPSEAIAAALYGSAWADYVIDVEPTLFSHYAKGEPMEADTAVDREALRTRDSLAEK
jgi:hypothetical protein